MKSRILLAATLCFFKEGKNRLDNAKRIKRKIVSRFAPLIHQLTGDSHNQGLDARRGRRFTLLLVSKSFEKETNIDRHRRVYQTFHQTLGAGVHALA